jgi:flagellar FliJ protein
MKRFSFELETLLRFRQNLEEKERNELSRLFYSLHREMQNLNSLQSRYHETMGDLAQKQNHSADPRELALFHLYLKRLEQEMEKSRNRIRQMEKDVEAQKQVVIEATKRTKILDTLKTRKRREYLAKADKEEQKTVDELVVTRFANRES